MIAVTNTVASSLTREADGVFYTHAGPEIGVASTKTFATQMVALDLLALPGPGQDSGYGNAKVTNNCLQNAVSDA